MSVDDSAVPTGQAAHSIEQVVVISPPSFEPAPEAVVGPRERRLRPIAASFFAVSGLIFFLSLLIESSTGARAFTFPEADTVAGVFGLALIAIACLLVTRNARRLSVGLALGFAAAYTSREIPIVRPSVWESLNSPQFAWVSPLTEITILLGGVAVLLAGLGSRPTVPRLRWSSVRVAALLIGVAGAVCWLAGECMNWDKFTTTLLSPTGEPSGPARVTVCCTFSDSDGWTRATMLTSGVVLLALAVTALIARSRVLGAGLLIGAVPAMTTDVIIMVFETLTPVQQPGATITTSPLAGFWITTGGLVLLLAAGALCLVPGSSGRTAAIGAAGGFAQGPAGGPAHVSAD